MSHLVLALVVASAVWLIRGAFRDQDEVEVERLLTDLEPEPAVEPVVEPPAAADPEPSEAPEPEPSEAPEESSTAPSPAS